MLKRIVVICCFIFLSTNQLISQEIGKNHDRVTDQLLGSWEMKKSTLEVKNGPLEGKLDLSDLVEEVIVFNENYKFQIEHLNVEKETKQLITGNWSLSESNKEIIFSYIESKPTFKENDFNSVWTIPFKLNRKKLTLYRTLDLVNLYSNSSESVKKNRNEMVYIKTK